MLLSLLSEMGFTGRSFASDLTMKQQVLFHCPRVLEPTA